MSRRVVRRVLAPLVGAALASTAACGGASRAPTDRPPPGPATVAVALADVGLEAGVLDRAADPCTDFYQFACGGWLAANAIPADRARWSRFAELTDRNQAALRTLIEAAAASPKDDVERTFGDYYASCTDVDAIERRGLDGVKPLLDFIAKATDPRGLGAALTALHKHQIFALWGLAPEADFLDSRTAILFVDSAGLGLPDRDYYLDDKFADARAAYQAHLAAVLALAGKGKAAAALAADVMTLETELAKVTKTAVERRDPARMYNPTDVDGLARTVPGFDWRTYFAGVGNPTPGKLAVTSPAYFAALPAIIKATRPATWQAYLTIKVIDATALALPKRFDDENFKLRAALTGVTEERPRWKRCIDATAAAMPELVGQPYVAANFPGESKDTAQKLIGAITDVMNAQMDTLPWMSAATKVQARGKLAKIEALVGYPDQWRVYDVTVDRANFAGNHLAAAAFEGRRQAGKGGKPYDRSEWLMPPFIVNAYYNPNANNTALPAGILQPPFFGKDRSIAANLGGIGMVVGHELTHGFDDQGAQFDADGNLKNWWQPDDLTQFKARGTCLAEQYSTFEALPGKHVNGELTLGENIADLGGIKHAFLAYRALRAGADKAYVADGLTEDQQFFVAVGQAWCAQARDEEALRLLTVDPHAPPKWRVNGALRNLPQFAAAFGCPAGAAMAPTQACAIW
ncbi:MAG: M13 family metallopeptidase [Myxococcales bacterium]|nr:M13 family metallopeptidase [Myxococcales bacterium]